MLTADLVDARKKDGELLLRPLKRSDRAEAIAIAETLLATSKSMVGRPRETLEAAFDELESRSPARRVKVGVGLRKLTLDACTFEQRSPVDPITLRSLVFSQASRARRALHDGERFDRSTIILESARSLSLAPEVVEEGLFSDLRDEHALSAAPTFDASTLVERWELAQAQAVLLAAIRVTCIIHEASPGLLRAFFAQLKFHQLLFTAERIASNDAAESPGWRIVIDGPFSLFESVTKYGLRLALMVPALRALERWSLEAELRWGKARSPLLFRLSSPKRARRAASPKKKKVAVATEPSSEPAVTLHLSDEARELCEGIARLNESWQAQATTTVLEARGHGVCIPDLELLHAATGARVFVEILGYWSRDAVFRRVELAEKGLAHAIVFAASARLRVSEDVLEESNARASLYMYKGKMSPRAILDRARALSGV
jgi:predicted nuclease of restriction endonuclease-like RecB superfamily